MQVRVDQAAHKAVGDVTTHNQGEQEEVRSKLFKAVKIAALVVGDTCGESAIKVIAEPEDVCGTDVPIRQMTLPARVVGVTEK